MSPYEQMEQLLEDDYDFCAESCDLKGAIGNLAKCVKHMEKYGHKPLEKDSCMKKLLEKHGV